MTVLLVLLLSILICTFYAYFLRKRNYWKTKKVPYVKPTPVLGNFGEYILLKKYVGHVSQDICRAFPDEPYVGAYYGSEPALVVKDPELLKLVMTKDFYYFNSREVSKYTDNEVLMQSLFFTQGDRWKVIRQNMTPIFSSAKLKNMYHLIAKCCSSLESLIELELSVSKVIEMRHLISRYMMDCVSACVFGVDANTMEKEFSKNPFYIISQKMLKMSTSLALRWIIRAIWPGIFYAFRFKVFTPEGDAFFKNLLLNVFKVRDSRPSTRNDFVDSILGFKNNKYIVGDSITNVKSGGDKKVELEADDDLLVAQSIVLFLAGFETSSTTTAFLLFELAKDKAAQRRVQEEIDDFLQRHDNSVDYDVVKDLPYTDACLNESLRLYPVLAQVTREVVEDYTLPTGLLLEKNMRVHIPIYYLHHNPDYFPEPEKFRPERFLGEEKLNMKPYTYMPFGEGPRICIGARFAKMTILSGLVTILKKYNLELAEGMPSSVAFDPRSITIQTATGINLKFTLRV